MNQALFSDLEVFVRNTQLQVRFVATTSVDRAIDAAVASLEEIEDLLGKPIQRELSMETGLDVALDALSDICTGTKSKLFLKDSFEPEFFLLDVRHKYV